MSLFSLLLAIACSIAFIASILFVIFGQVTVRKLRKNPATRDALGIEFVSGWDILNVANALALPKKYNRWRRKSFLAALHADSDLLDNYANRFDRFLAKLFFTLWIFSGFSMLILMLLYEIGAFKAS